MGYPMDSTIVVTKWIEGGFAGKIFRIMKLSKQAFKSNNMEAF